MTTGDQPAIVQPAEHPPGCPWLEDLRELFGRISELNESHQTLAKVVKDTYRHSQQTFLMVRDLSSKVDGLIANAEHGSKWRQEIQELQGVMAEMLAKVAAAVDNPAKEG
jgi:hypothetical protein